jgi:hypothetical protein
MAMVTPPEVVRPQRCGARRPAARAFGWTCDGTGLVKVQDGPDGIPVAMRADLLDEYRAGAVIPPPDEPEAIPERADHLHAPIGRRIDECLIAAEFGAWLVERGALTAPAPVLAWARQWSEDIKGRRP